MFASKILSHYDIFFLPLVACFRRSVSGELRETWHAKNEGREGGGGGEKARK